MRYLKVNYISAEGASNLKTFTYSGQNDSILYKYFLSGFAQKIVDYLPVWLAPNLITLIGSLFFLSSVILHLIYNPTWNEAIPNWLCYYTAFCIFMYQTLDNCDGKQARKTGSASPMGMLFDHGTDCVVQWLIGMLLMSLVQMEQNSLTFFAWVIVANYSFYFGIYQQQHTGHFILGKINGVDEGLPLIQFIFCVSGYFGPQMWQQQIPYFGTSLDKALSLLFIFVGFDQIYQFGSPAIKKLGDLKSILRSLTLIMTYSFTVTSIILFTSSHVFKEHMLLVMFILGFQWSKIISILQVSLITKDKFDQGHFSWLYVQAVTVITLSINFDDKSYLSRHMVLKLLLLYSFTTYVQCILSLIHQLSEILGIKVFTIVPKIRKNL